MSSSKLKKLIQNGYFKFDLDKKEFVSLKKILNQLSKKKIQLHCVFENMIAKNKNNFKAINDLI
jgi:hypothetical protein